MDPKQMQAGLQKIKAIIEPWHNALQDPPKAQETVLQQLLKIYAQTSYGKDHAADKISSLQDYRQKFPIQTYDDFKPVIEKVMAGETSLLLNENPIGWAITRGTTKGENKFIPMTPTDLQARMPIWSC